MKARAREERRRAAVATAMAKEPRAPKWAWAAALGAALIAAFWVYSPAMHGPFLFDDTALPFALPDFSASLAVWLRNVRPFLYFTYWLNAQISGDDSFSYHVVNVLLHVVSSGLVFLMVRRLAEWARIELSKRDLLSGFAAAVFLLHPVQTEAVAYLAGRSEALSVMLVFAAYTLFLCRKRTEVSWALTIGILALFALALLSKEHTVVLPAVLLLTDYWWNPGFSFRGIRANWRLYAPMAVGAVLGVVFFWRLIMTAETAGFGMKDLPWYQYFFTQCRALFAYIGMFLLPARLTADWDFAISRTILDRGAIFGLLALVALVALAWVYRRRFPLASFGFLLFLVLMAPTSSVLPIRDPIAERRLYFAMPGLLLIAVDLLSRVRVRTRALATACAAVALIAAIATHARAAVWSDPITLWRDTAAKSPEKARVRFQLGFAYYDAGLRGEPCGTGADAHRCFELAIQEFQKTAQIEPPTYNLLVDWALAYDAQGKPDQALEKLRQAAQMEPTAHVYSQIGMIYAKNSQWDPALEALAKAEKADPNFAMTYVYRGNIYLKTGRPADAVPQYQRALQLQPSLPEAQRYLLIAVEAQRAQARGIR